jgi:hypothetical protein
MAGREMLTNQKFHCYEGIADETIQPCNSKLASLAVAGAIN